MSGFIYIWRDKKHNRYYIGSHWGSENDGYICSSSWMKQSYKHRPNDFKRRIMKRIFSNRQDLLNEEDRWLDMIKQEEFGKRYYNLQKHWKHWNNDPNKAKTVANKISQANKGKVAWNKGKKGLKQSPEHIEKRRLKMIGNKSRTGMKTDPTITQKISQSNIGKHSMPRTNEWKKKISLAKLGFQHSEATKVKMSHSHQLRHESERPCR